MWLCSATEQPTFTLRYGRPVLPYGLVNAGSGGGGGFLVVAANPYVAVADTIAPEGYKMSEVLRGTAAAVSSIIEGTATDDTRAAESFHERSKAGHYGVVMKLAS